MQHCLKYLKIRRKDSVALTPRNGTGITTSMTTTPIYMYGKILMKPSPEKVNGDL